MIGDHEFRREFSVAIRVCWAQGAFFGNRDHARDTSGIAVDSSGGGVDDVGDVVAGGGAEEGEGPRDVDVVVV